MGRTKTKPFLKPKKVPKLYFHFWPPKKCPPFFFLTYTWRCENITASPCVPKRVLYWEIEKILSKTQKHDKRDGAEKLLSISQCQMTVVYSVTVLSASSGSFPERTWLKFGIGSRLLEVLYIKSKKKTQVPICLFEVPICLIEVPNCPWADLSWYRNVSHRCRFFPVPKCLEFVQNVVSTFQLLYISMYYWPKFKCIFVNRVKSHV